MAIMSTLVMLLILLTALVPSYGAQSLEKKVEEPQLLVKLRYEAVEEPEPEVRYDAPEVVEVEEPELLVEVEEPEHWVAFHIIYMGPGSIRVMNAKLDSGKWYDPNEDKELETVNGVEIKNGGPAGTVSASGLEPPRGTIVLNGTEGTIMLKMYPVTGTEGTIELYHVQGGKKLVEIYFDCPWYGKNKISKKTFSDNVIVDISDWSTSGALGNINVKIGYFGTSMEQA